MASHYVPLPTYATPPITTVLTQHQPQPSQHLHSQNPFAYGHYHPPMHNNVISPYTNTYIQTRPALNCPTPSDSRVVRGIPFCRPARQGFVIEDQPSLSPIKNESLWSPQSDVSTTQTSVKSSPSLMTKSAAGEVTFGTDVDTLMKAIQSKASNTTQSNGKITKSRPGEEIGNAKPIKKRYQCTIEGCTKSFFQKTHLDIHERAHTGVKPYSCKQPGCDRTFSQLGNLKTHERRHTGERPYQCELCGKRFAQRGNVRAHKIVHDQSKPYICKLDECGKQFTQLGNLKSHQNKFHTDTLRALTTKFASVQDGDPVHPADKELWEYFANLYKNSNKGIKGRGKDRKVGGSHAISSMRNLTVHTSDGYGLNGPGRGNMLLSVNMNTSSLNSGRPNCGTPSNIYDECGRRSLGNSVPSSADTCFDDAPSDGFTNISRSGHMSLGDRIYQ